MLELARRVAALVGSESRIELVPYEDAYEAGFEDVPRRVPDITLIRDLTGWQPTRTLDDILTEIIAEAAAEEVTVSAGLV
jgi:UDP-glucose 4-epimerase